MVYATDMMTGNMTVNSLFIDPVTHTIKQKTIVFQDNIGLTYINWDVFLLGQHNVSDFALKEVIFSHNNPRLVLQMSSLDQGIQINKVTINSSTALKQVKVDAVFGIRRVFTSTDRVRL